MRNGDLIPILLLILLSLTMAAGSLIVLLVLNWRGRRVRAAQRGDVIPLAAPHPLLAQPPFAQRPSSWLAVRSRNPHDVQIALGLSNPQPCTLSEGLAGEQKLFIAPPVRGWILIIGSGLPDPSDDIDACFRFLLDLSRELGQVQFFQSIPILGYHAWARLECGHVVRGYAWAGQTLWNQGLPSRAERDLGLQCFSYFESPEQLSFGQSDVLSANTEKVPQLAARWSLDPAALNETFLERAYGIAGEPRRLY